MSILNLYHMKLWHELKSTVKFIHKTVLRLQYAFVLCYNYVLILKLFTIASNVVNFFELMMSCQRWLVMLGDAMNV